MVLITKRAMINAYYMTKSSNSISTSRAGQTADFEKVFGKGSGLRMTIAPGRSNLIGEHTDYNEGLVLPIAVSEHTKVLFRPNSGKRISVYSDVIAASGNADPRDEFPLTNITPATDAGHHWGNYVRGVGAALVKRGVKLKGGDLYITGDLPQGAGLSSSAALEISTGLALLALAGKNMDRQELAFAGQEAEHKFVGVRTGIMDQTVVARAKAGNAMLLDCRSLEVMNIPIALSGYSFALFDTGVRHKLASSEYNNRRAECEHAAKVMKHKSLRTVGLEDILKHSRRLTVNENKRVRHVVTENLRVAQFAAALTLGDVNELGRLLNLSHHSLALDYEVSAPELDAIVARLSELNAKDGACPGARMTGGGFGGAVVALLKTSAFPKYEKALKPLAKGGSRLLKSCGGATVS
jgi:galactokinase